MNLLLLNLLLIAAFGNAIPVAHTKVHPIARQSAEYDAFFFRQERQSPNQCPPNTWYSISNKKNCESLNYTQFDRHQRRTSGFLATARSQGSCGSCWAFAATGTFTDLRNIASGERLSDQLSPQYLTTCATDPNYVGGGNGCCGSRGWYAACIFKTIGATTEECLPYTLKKYSIPGHLRGDARQDYKDRNPLPTCKSTCSNGMAYNPSSLKVEDYTVIESPTPTEVMTALNKGPIMARMYVTDSFKKYACGVFCNAGRVLGTHAVEIVDYGTTDTGIDFYVVKNSWDTDWGENGYFRIKRGDLGVGTLEIVELILTSSPSSFVKRSSFPSDLPRIGNCDIPGRSIATCSIESVNNPSSDELIMIVANFVIKELNDRSLVNCSDNVTIAGPISLSSVSAATIQSVAGTLFDITMLTQVAGCCAGGGTIDVNITAEVFQELNGNFTLTAYAYSSGIGMNVCIILLFGAIFLTLSLLEY